VLSEDSGSASLTLPPVSAARLKPFCQSQLPNRKSQRAPHHQAEDRFAYARDHRRRSDDPRLTEHLRHWLLFTLLLAAGAKATINACGGLTIEAPGRPRAVVPPTLTPRHLPRRWAIRDATAMRLLYLQRLRSRHLAKLYTRSGPGNSSVQYDGGVIAVNVGNHPGGPNTRRGEGAGRAT
jgi:hypothetical protein